MAVLGIDTSCYRTSLALVSDGAILADERRLLTVELGGRGMRQSEALFQHVGHLGALCGALFEGAPDARVDAVCVSARPRGVEGSYMPVFTAGMMAARAVAAACRAPLFETSHQQGHLRAALVDSGMGAPGDFLAIHLSGGTTEILRVDARLSRVELLGATTDLNAGQLVDRIGVMLGLPFPAGPALEELAGGAVARALIPTANKGLALSLSGAEAQLKRMIGEGVCPQAVACEAYSLIERTLAKWIEAASSETGLECVLIAGGVAASPRLRRDLKGRLQKRGCGVKLYWARPALSGDNAVGVALIGEAMWLQERKGGEATT